MAGTAARVAREICVDGKRVFASGGELARLTSGRFLAVAQGAWVIAIQEHAWPTSVSATSPDRRPRARDAAGYPISPVFVRQLRIELRKEEVSAAGARQRSAAKVNGSFESSCHEDASRTIDRHSQGVVQTCTPEALA